MNLAEHGISLRTHREGNYKTRCPRCSATRKKKNDPSLSVTIDSRGAVWNCHNAGCGLAGSANTEKPAREWRKPSYNPKPVTENLVEFFSGRGITAPTLVRNRISLGRRYFPQTQKEEPCILFPFYRDSECVNVKYRTRDKHFTQEKDAEPIFYGMDDVPEDSSTLIICEGEIDKLSFNEAGIWNVVSVPSGATESEVDAGSRKMEFLAICSEWVDSFDDVILALDNDKPGIVFREALATIIGKDRCQRVAYPADCKDANDVWLKHGAAGIEQLLESARPYPVEGLFTANDFADEIDRLYDTGHQRGVALGWRGFDELYRVHPGNLTIVTGSPGSGKSQFVDDICFRLARDQNWSIGVCSFENPKAEHVAKLIHKHVGKHFHSGKGERMTRAEMQEAREWVDKHFYFFQATHEGATVDWLLRGAKQAIRQLGVNGLVIDPWNRFEHQCPKGLTETQYITQTLSRIQKFAQLFDVHIWLVAHPKQLGRNASGEYPVPSMWDISGSAAWYTIADFGMVVHRLQKKDGVRGTDTEVYIKKVRFNHMGQEGMATFEYFANRNQYDFKPDA